jgi:hypothetical protein
MRSMHAFGLVTKKLGTSRKASTGHTAAQFVYLHWIHGSVTT